MTNDRTGPAGTGPADPEGAARDGASRLREAVGGEAPSLVPYLVAGDPDPDRSRALVEALAAGGAAAIELGLPFSDPVAEGPTIQAAMGRALDAGMTPAGYLEFAAALDVDVPLVSMTYYNPIVRYGDGDGVDPEPFVAAAAEAGIAGFVVPDLPVDEAGPMRAACERHGLALAPIAAPTADAERLERVVGTATGFLYVQARLGTTGARADLSARTAEHLARLPGTDVPTAVGFGVAEPDQAKAVIDAGADAVVVGSAIVDVAATADDPVAAVETLTRRLAQGALAGGSQSAGDVDVDHADGDASSGDESQPERT